MQLSGMSRKISEYFNVIPKVQKSANCDKNDKILKKSSEIRECQVIIKDIKGQFGMNLNLFEETSLNKSQKIELIKNGSKTCKFCQKEFSTKSSLRTHVKNIHFEEFKIIFCSICSEKFFTQTLLDRHMKNKHPDGQFQQFECDFDGKIFKKKMCLFQHMRVHQIVECKICNKKLKYNSAKSHLKFFHETEKNF